MNDLIYQIIDKFNILTVKEQYNFVFNHPDKVIVEADYKRIYQVIYNLVNNAINYTGEDKTVTINIKEQKDTYLIEIIDTGKGIKKKNLPISGTVTIIVIKTQTKQLWNRIRIVDC